MRTYHSARLWFGCCSGNALPTWLRALGPLKTQAFVEVLASNETFSAPMADTYELLGLDAGSTTTLESYLSEYYTSILKKLKEVGASSRQTDFYV
jgi:hypothetical protein